MTESVSTSPTPFFGIWVVRAAFVLAAFGWGVGFYGPPIFLHAVVERTGWEVSTVSIAVTVHFLSGALVIPRLPRWHRELGVPRTLTIGAMASALGTFGWATAAYPWQLYAAALLSGVGWVTMGAVAVNAVVSPWFVRTRPVALSRAYNGASIGGVIFSPLWVVLIDRYGFAQASLIVGAGTLAVMVLLGRYVFAQSPEGRGQHPDGLASPAPTLAASAAPVSNDIPRLWRDRAFLTLALGMSLGLFAQIGLVAHLFSLLAPHLGNQAAGMAMSAATGVAILGRSLGVRAVALTGDRRRVAAVSYVLQATGSICLLIADPQSVGLMLVGVALFGLGIGNATSLPPLIAQSDFPASQVPRVVAMIVAAAQTTYAFAPAMFGVLMDMSNTPGDAGLGARSVGVFGCAFAVQLAAATAMLIGRRRHSTPLPDRGAIV